MFNLKSFLLICLLVMMGGVNLRVSAADITYKQLGAGDAIKTDGTKYAIQFYKLYNNGSHDFTNSFLGNLGVYTSANRTYVITVATNTKSNGGTSVKDIETIIDGSKTEYLFTFEKNAKGETIAKNVNDGTYWGKNSNSRPCRVQDASSAVRIEFQYQEIRTGGESAFVIYFDGIWLYLNSSSTIYPTAKQTPLQQYQTYYKIYEIIEPKADQVNYKYYDVAGTALNKTA